MSVDCLVKATGALGSDVVTSMVANHSPRQRAASVEESGHGGVVGAQTFSGWMTMLLPFGILPVVWGVVIWRWYQRAYRPVRPVARKLEQFSRSLAASASRWHSDGRVSIRNVLNGVGENELLARGTWGGLPASIQYGMRPSAGEVDELMTARTILRLTAPRQLAKWAGLNRFPPSPSWAWLRPPGARSTQAVQHGGYQYNPVHGEFYSWGMNGEECRYFTPAFLARLQSLPCEVLMGGRRPGVEINGAEIQFSYGGHVDDPSAIEAGFRALEEIAAQG